MATVIDHKTLDCPVCLKIYISPRVLPCQHTLCEKCIDTHVTSQLGSGTECVCPLCNSSIVPPDPALPVDEWTNAFPLHSLICSLLESAEVSDNGENVCEPCKNDGETVTADVWCTDCRERLCHSCDKSHRRTKLQKNHRAVPISEMEQELQSNIPFDQNCDRHHSKEIELFCLDHKKLCCSLCIATDHRQCNDVRVIDDIARELTQGSTPVYLGIISDIKKIKTEMEKLMSLKTKNITQISQEKQFILLDMDKRIDKMIVELNKLRSEFRNEADHLHKEIEKSILKNKKSVQSFMTTVENSSKVLQVVEKKGNSRQKFTTSKNITIQITSHYEHLKSRLTEDTEVHLRMESSKVLSDIEGAMKSLDTVQVSKKPCTSTKAVLQSTDGIIRQAYSRTNLRTATCAAQVNKRDLMTSPVNFIKAVATKKLGEGARITGGTFCSDGRLLMADFNNKRLLQLDDDYNVVNQYKIDGSPTDVAVGNNDNEIFIAINQQDILKCTLDTRLTVVSRIKGPRGTCGITISGDHMVVGTETAVVILKSDGSVVRSIPRSGSYASYVATSLSQQKICHTDNNDVVCRSLDGKELFRHKHQQLRFPLGVCIDTRNNLYACGFDSHNIHQVSLDRHCSRIIVDKLHSISQPYRVMFNPQRDELIVTSRTENMAFEVYRLG